MAEAGGLGQCSVARQVWTVIKTHQLPPILLPMMELLLLRALRLGGECTACSKGQE